MKPNHVLILMILGAAVEEGCRAYLQSHSIVDSAVSGVRVASLTMLTGLAPSPMQSRWDALQGAVLTQGNAFAPLQARPIGPQAGSASPDPAAATQ